MTNQNVEDRINNHYLLGVIKADREAKYYLAPVAWWILDYPSYDPSILNEKDADFVFRDNLLSVSPTDKELFLKAMEDDEVKLTEILEYNSRHIDAPIHLQFIVDFDTSEFYSSFYDIDIHEYVPGQWKGYYQEELTLL